MTYKNDQNEAFKGKSFFLDNYDADYSLYWNQNNKRKKQSNIINSYIYASSHNSEVFFIHMREKQLKHIWK